MPTPNTYVCTLSAQQAEELRLLLEDKGWELDTVPYARWRGRLDGLCVVAYQSGKATVQGKGMADFIRFTLEPQVLKTFSFGYETELAELRSPEMFEPHAGIDESGKGDFLGPLCVAACYTTKAAATALLKAGVADSKTIKSDARIKQLDGIIRKQCAGQFSLIILHPETYNRLYDSIGNLNRLLAWGHAKALENLLELVPSCPRAIDDQFASDTNVVRRALQERGRRIQLEQHPRAEADVAVAAASILARAAFVRQMESLSQEAGIPLPKGGGQNATAAARQLFEKLGENALRRFAKLHFKNTQEVFSQ